FTCLHGGANPPPSTPILPDTRGVTSCDCDPDQRSVLLNLDVYDIGPAIPRIFKSCRIHLMETIRAHIFPATPLQPRVAFTIRFIRLYQSLFNVTGISATNMALVVQQLMRYGLTFSRQMETHTVSSTLRRQLQPALAWLTVVDRYCDKVALEGPILVDKARPPVDTDDLHLELAHLADSCPACFQSFRESTSPGSQFVEAPQVIVCVDGTFTQKRRHGRHGAGRQPFPPRRFLSRAQVEEVAVLMGRAEGTAPDDTLCAARVRAADAEDARGGSPFEIRGVMGLCCRHDIPLLLCDIDSPGERHYYTVALIRALAQAVGPNLKHLGVAYDIGCRFQPSEKVANVLGPALKITWKVPVFHVYGHMYSCQVHFSPRNTRGFGMTDGEGTERIWSAMESLIKNTRNMSAGERRFALEERVRFIATERRINLIDILDVKAKRLNDIIERARTILVEKFDASDLPSWYREYEEQHQEDESGDLFQDRSIIIHLRPAYQASKCFEGIDPGVLTAVGLLSHRRRLQLDHQQARDSTSSPPTGSTSPSTSPSSSSVHGDPADSDDDEHPAAAQSSISPVGICACALLREISEVQLLSAMLVIRPAKVRKGYATTVKFRQGISAARLRAGKAMNKLNEALLERHRLHGGELPIQLDSRTLYGDTTLQLVEQWARNAYEQLGRCAEESGRLTLERTSANNWIEQRRAELNSMVSAGTIVSRQHADGGEPDVDDSNEDELEPEQGRTPAAEPRQEASRSSSVTLFSRSVVEAALTGLENLKRHWARDEDLADLLMPVSDASLTAYGDDTASGDAALPDDDVADASEGARLVRELAIMVLPVTLPYLDKATLNLANLLGLQQDLGLKDQEFSTSGSSLYISYLVLSPLHAAVFQYWNVRHIRIDPHHNLLLALERICEARTDLKSG
ncbi:hypothetical protein V8E36_008211, partial [Tilletia maclaganii]